MARAFAEIEVLQELGFRLRRDSQHRTDMMDGLETEKRGDNAVHGGQEAHHGGDKEGPQRSTGAAEGASVLTARRPTSKTGDAADRDDREAEEEREYAVDHAVAEKAAHHVKGEELAEWNKNSS